MQARSVPVARPPAGRRGAPPRRAALLKRSPINFHPLVNTMSTRIEAEKLLHFLEATGHKPLIAALSSAE